MHFSLHHFPIKWPATTAKKLAVMCPTAPPTIMLNRLYLAANPIAEIYDLSPISAITTVVKRAIMFLKLF